MLRRGKNEGWLSLPAETIPSFLKLNSIQSPGVRATSITGRGNALVATTSVPVDLQSPLVTVPQEIILSKESVWVHAKSDSSLREVLEACGDFASTTRISILIFLLVQATYSCPAASRVVGVQHAFTNYIKYLPLELLPTFWTDDELALVEGTTLKPATDAKLSSLYREFEHLRRATSQVKWCQDTWWDEIDGILDFDDWKVVDAVYRSRALEFPGIGDAMVPYIDFANHASGDDTTASYQADGDGNGLLLRHATHPIKQGTEVTITYGDEKGACELLFSYGFLEDDMTDARTLFLSIDIPNGDPLKRAKQTWASCAPGVRLTSRAKYVDWESDFIWLLVVNEEDGLEFVITQTVDGERELRLHWNSSDVRHCPDLKNKLQSHPMWDIFQLRAIVILEARILDQKGCLDRTDSSNLDAFPNTSNVRVQVATAAQKLRSLEDTLLQVCAEHLAAEKDRLITSPTIQDYLALQQAQETEEDFS